VGLPEVSVQIGEASWGNLSRIESFLRTDRYRLPRLFQYLFLLKGVPARARLQLGWQTVQTKLRRVQKKSGKSEEISSGSPFGLVECCCLKCIKASLLVYS